MKKLHSVIFIIGIGLVALFDGLFLTTDLFSGLAEYNWMLAVEMMAIALLATYLLQKQRELIVKLIFWLHAVVLIIGYGLHISGIFSPFESFPQYLLGSMLCSFITYLYIAKSWKYTGAASYRKSYFQDNVYKQHRKDTRDMSLAGGGALNKFSGTFKHK